MSYAEKYLQNFTKEEAIKSVEGIIRPKMFKMVLPNAVSVQDAMPEALQTKWSKLLEDVDKSAAILTTLHKALYKQDNSGIPELSTLALNSVTPAEVVMVFGAFKTKVQQGKYCKLLQRDLGESFTVIKLNGDDTSNRQAEELVESQVAKAQRKGKRVIIVSKDMASRSFSIPQVDTVFLMFDNGLVSQVSQKTSRAFTPGKTFKGLEKTDGAVVSLSFDANRMEIDPIDLYIIAEAVRIEEEDEAIQESIRRICQSVNIFQNDLETFGSVQVESDKYAEDLLSKSSALKEAAATISLESNVDKYLAGLLEGRSSSPNKRDRSKELMDIRKVKTAVVNGEEKEATPITPNERKRFIQNVLFFIDNVTVLNDIEGYSAKGLVDTLTSIQAQNLIQEVERVYGLSFETIQAIVEDGVVPVRILNSVLDGNVLEVEDFF